MRPNEISQLKEWKGMALYEIPENVKYTNDNPGDVPEPLRGEEIESTVFKAGSDRIKPLVFIRCTLTRCAFRFNGPVIFIDCRLNDCLVIGDVMHCFHCCVVSLTELHSHATSLGGHPNMDWSRLQDDLAQQLARTVEINASLFEECTFRYPIGGRVQGSVFAHCKVIGSGTVRNQMNDCRLKSCVFVRPGSEKIIYGGTIEKTKFEDVEFGPAFRFDSVTIRNCEITKASLLTLEDKRGGLTQANLAEFKIIDEVGDVRRRFHGINRLIHWVSLGSFLLPMAGFVALKSWQHALAPDKEGSLLIMQLLRYIVSGYETSSRWTFDLTFMGVFVLNLGYQLARVTLLSRLQTIEADEAIREAPSPISIRVWWCSWAIPFVHYGAWFALGLFIVNCILFGLTSMPD